MVGVYTTLKVAKELPPILQSKNAFANSYRYDRDEDVLYVHEKRFATSGDLGICIMHACAHIKADTGGDVSLADDNEPAFTKEFYQNIKSLSGDLFRKSAKSSEAYSTSGSSGSETSKLRASMSGMDSPVGTAQASFGLDMMNVTSSPSSLVAPSQYFSSAALQNRIKLYETQGGAAIPDIYFQRYAEDHADSKTGDV